VTWASGYQIKRRKSLYTLKMEIAEIVELPTKKKKELARCVAYAGDR
jgi:hypothetical protein